MILQDDVELIRGRIVLVTVLAFHKVMHDITFEPFEIMKSNIHIEFLSILLTVEMTCFANGSRIEFLSNFDFSFIGLNHREQCRIRF